ncbi:protein of unknown function [Serratia sp. Tan611]|nr:protein of unknown function [Serratia sp. Tan611]
MLSVALSQYHVSLREMSQACQMMP